MSIYSSIPPTAPYSGLTVLLQNPSRFDLHARSLLTGTAGTWYRNKVAYEISKDKNVWSQINVAALSGEATLKDISLPSETKLLLYLGRSTLNLDQQHTPLQSRLSLNAIRGSINTTSTGLQVIQSYTPQDAFDPIDFEARKNPMLVKTKSEGTESSRDDSEDGEESGEVATEKDRSRTSRGNYRFYLEQDTRKAFALLRGQLPEEPALAAVIAPSNEDLRAYLQRLRGLENATIYLDIETDTARHINTLGIAINDEPVWVLPLLNHDYSRPYDSRTLAQLLLSLNSAFSRNVVVCHNSLFDLFVLAREYSITPPTRVFDTMLAQHRIFPEAEKSLGHCISLWTRQPYHKDEGIFMPRSAEEQERLMLYNAKDVHTTRLVKLAQERYIGFRPGLTRSVAQVNESVYPYLCNSLRGIRIDLGAARDLIEENSRLLVQYQRIIDILVGPELSLLPTSPKSCTQYFHQTLGYDIVARTATGAPQLDEKALYSLKLKNPGNVVIDFILAYRQTLKENSLNKTVLWKQKTPALDRLSLPTIPKLNSLPSEQWTVENVLSLMKDPCHCSTSTSPTGSKEETCSTDLKQSETLQSSQVTPNEPQQNEKPKLLPSQTLRLTTEWKLAGTTTFRLASAKLLGTHGTNLQNPGKSQLKCYVPDAGKVFLQVDQSGAEALIVAYICDPGAFRDLFLCGIKPHVYVALHVFSEHWREEFPDAPGWLKLKPKDLKAQPGWKACADRIKADDERYALAKMVCHASNYDMGVNTFRVNTLVNSGGTLVLSQKEASRLLNTYHSLFPEIRRWHARVMAELRSSGMLRNLFGYPRGFYGQLDSSSKEAYAFIPQSTVGTITNLAFTEVQRYIDREAVDWQLLNNKHDSILMQCPEGDLELARNVLSNAMQPEMSGLGGVKFKMRTESATGRNWAKYHPVKNPEGLKEF